jgi:hypothetical protein
MIETMRCPSCGVRLRVPADTDNYVYTCPRCLAEVDFDQHDPAAITTPTREITTEPERSAPARRDDFNRFRTVTDSQANRDSRAVYRVTWTLSVAGAFGLLLSCLLAEMTGAAAGSVGPAVLVVLCYLLVLAVGGSLLLDRVSPRRPDDSPEARTWRLVGHGFKLSALSIGLFIIGVILLFLGLFAVCVCVSGGRF